MKIAKGVAFQKKMAIRVAEGHARLWCKSVIDWPKEALWVTVENANFKQTCFMPRLT